MTKIYKSVAGGRVVQARYRELLSRWPVPNEHLRVPTCEGDTFVIASGPEGAPAVMLFHGSAFNSVTWMGDIEAWAQHFRVYAVDIVGHPGLSAPSRPRYDTEAHALWIDDVMRGLGVMRASMVGISLGGWLAIDYASRRPDRVTSLALLAPGGVGRELMSTTKLLFTVLPLFVCGDWGRRKAMEKILGPVPFDDGSEARAVAEFNSLISKYFRQRLDKPTRFSDEVLQRLVMPTFLVVGGQDPMLDSAETKVRLREAVTRLEILELPNIGHAVMGQTEPILAFLQGTTGTRVSL